ncbi:hypothetical protein NSZ01_40380 [Nocardioides szechwanensis]|uniref:Uncharacterized protein n=1 Tax=Nocardioides szechwanensis TaxID=1005944 RepID=A0A1H0LIM4_9ACTN|nr:hypothetical protein [Nocardioides szechwanensis]GEP36270.1 hypothetical protein NSZ01_40380 [Nocardioides szechwanensis]SDO68014.1 hypothetical protein SAMN05192576_0258 [Nocardioides szechwanensis]
MTDPDARLRELLDRAAPGSPDVDAASRTAAVVRRGRAARRRDRGLVAGAAAAVLALAVGVPLALGGDDGPVEVASPPPVITAAPCPAEPIDVTAAAPIGDLGDVVSVRSCPATWEQGGALPVDPEPLPTQPLTGDAAAAFAEDVAALPPYEMPFFCATINLGPSPWALLIESADGGPTVVGSTMRMCSSVDIATTPKGVDQVIAALVGNLERQQAADLTPGADGPSCPDGDRLAEGADTWNASFDIASATDGMVCYVADPLGGVEYRATEGKLHEQTLATIRDDLDARVGPEPEPSMCTDTGPQRLLVLTNDEGDRAAYVDDRCSGGFTGAQGYWQPSDAAEAAIREALGGRVSPR